ncbi:DUF2612 domain-containing protein [Klebsiella pneumoniae]|uniref:DUF2612 domain-containing protein n=1 Tax=Klebsiella pneumoniae TaxID=573 RepID=UPI000EFA2DA3|nr:DUF2612 domain-containing protein [Klebsiella pneumoniae]EKX6528334.1 DUF2612 domain-containing protein [Klebsiella pneumoniae]EKX6688050.1 DUF2612 domain-containing protein [Klebsiella pneumoniae]MBS2754252.1 DUF2612 domain-containing protein [Klebsiella pneumoniae]MBS2759740.1 DUF2612 domain-containing protein [Klebsiella pneumoniae]MBS2769689.1 DUF2612 domain-containing protein [Klebsiella pneumoniae]
MNNVDWTIYAQYVNSTSLRSLIDTFNASVAPEDWIDTFYDLVFNIETCGDYGLMCWGKIVDVERLLTVTPSQQFLGFGEATSTPAELTDPQPFNQAPFYTGVQDTNTVVLTNEAYRKLIMCKAMANISDCTVPVMNRMLMYMFGASGRAYVRNDGNHVMSYVFEFQLSDSELAIVQSSGALPSPPGVKVNIVQEV